MYNVAFLSFDANENHGGVQRVSFLLAKGFAKKGIKSFLIYDKSASEPSTCYDGKIFYRGVDDNDKLEQFIKDNSIKYIINNCVVKSVHTGGEIKEILNRCSCKLISIIHAKPDLIKVTPSVYSLKWAMRRSQSMATKFVLIFKLLIFPLYKQYSNKKYIDWRRCIYENSSKIIVLSKYYVDCFCNMLKVDDSKVLSISNPLNFNYTCSENDINKKYNEILIVSRLEESAKGLSRVFKAWKIIEQASNNSNWKLTIVGSGEDMEYYQKLCSKLDLKRVKFEGHKNPFEYYQRAKIFVMSSFHEGLPMTLLEAEQMGLAVVAINNFESLQELVIDGINGFLVENREECIANKLQYLMDNPDLCKKFAISSVKNSKLFSSHLVVEKWIQLFNTLEDENITN